MVNFNRSQEYLDESMKMILDNLKKRASVSTYMGSSPLDAIPLNMNTENGIRESWTKFTAVACPDDCVSCRNLRANE